AERYDDDILTRLAEIAADLPPFTARVSGLGVFAAPSPIVYLAMVRNTVLSHHHELLWSKLVGHAYTSNLHYHPEAWVPHITLAQGDVTSESLPAVMTYLSDMTFDWDIHIDNLALVFADGLEQGIKQEFALSKPVDAAPNES
ncbi:MAG: 2'-5' RNA ligase family protein, partial [Deinococcota bacterium]